MACLQLRGSVAVRASWERAPLSGRFDLRGRQPGRHPNHEIRKWAEHRYSHGVPARRTFCTAGGGLSRSRAASQRKRTRLQSGETDRRIGGKDMANSRERPSSMESRRSSSGQNEGYEEEDAAAGRHFDQ